MDGTLGNERAPLQDGRECDYGPYYRRSDTLQSLDVIPSSTLTFILVRKVRVKQETLRYHQHDVQKCVDVTKDYENYFNATVFEKVNNECRDPERYLLRWNFTSPTQASYWKDELGINLPISRSLNLYDRSNQMDQTNTYPF